jgi:acetyltransferase-like isoleucine patch superfamily enzyme
LQASQSAAIQAVVLAPIALFVYSRPEHTRRTLQSLARCPEWARSQIFVYADGAKKPELAAEVAETRRVVRALAPHATLVEQPTNRGLARSIIAGTTELCERFGRVIVVEDDLDVAPGFLAFLNAGLDRYADDDGVMQVSAYQFPVELDPQALFLGFPTSWGWATWKRAWQHFDPDARGYGALVADPQLRHRFDLDGSYPYFEMLERQRRGEVDSWAIRWHLSVFLRAGLVLYPGRTLVANTGFDGSGTHGGVGQGFADDHGAARDHWELPAVVLDEASQRRVFSFLAGHRPAGRIQQVQHIAAKYARTLLSGPLPARVRATGAGLLARVGVTAGRLLRDVRHLRNAQLLDACGTTSQVRGSVEKRGPGSRIEVGEGCLIDGTLVTEAPNAHISIGSNTFIGGKTLLAAVKEIIVEDDVLISYECVISDSDNHSLRYSERKHDLHDWLAGHHDWEKFATAPVRICKGAWLGARVMVAKGVTIGEGAVVGMGSVVTKDVAPYTIVAGNPARVIRELGPDER